MRNAIRYDQRITIGGVPTREDLAQLEELGYRTLVDVRSEDERFGGSVEREAARLGLEYVSIPIERTDIKIEQVRRFYMAVFETGEAPLYAFSRFGKRPLALLVLFDVVANGESAVKAFQKAARYGLNLNGDLNLQVFLIRSTRSGVMEPIVKEVLESRKAPSRKWE